MDAGSQSVEYVGVNIKTISSIKRHKVIVVVVVVYDSGRRDRCAGVV